MHYDGVISKTRNWLRPNKFVDRSDVFGQIDCRSTEIWPSETIAIKRFSSKILIFSKILENGLAKFDINCLDFE